jgi:hypothetical protein
MGDAHRKVKAFLLVRFLCGSTKKMNPVVGPGPDGYDCFYSHIKPFKTVGARPDRRLAFFAWSKESQQRKDRACSGHVCYCLVH